MHARDIMTTHPSVVARGDTIAHAAILMHSRHVGMLPVIDDLCARHLVGVLTDHDIVTRCVAKGQSVERAVGDVMTTHNIAVAHVDTSTDDVIALMRQRRVRRIPVLDEHERAVGVIALADLASRLMPSDTQVLREVRSRVSNAHVRIDA